MNTYPATFAVSSVRAGGYAQQSEAPSSPQVRVHNWLADRREVRRINRAYRRQQRAYDRAFDQTLGSPSAQQELYAIRATRH